MEATGAPSGLVPLSVLGSCVQSPPRDLGSHSRQVSPLPLLVCVGTGVWEPAQSSARNPMWVDHPQTVFQMTLGSMGRTVRAQGL